MQATEWRKKVDFESLDSIPSMLSDRSEGGGHISDHMNRYKKVLMLRMYRDIYNIVC